MKESIYFCLGIIIIVLGILFFVGFVPGYLMSYRCNECISVLDHSGNAARSGTMCVLEKKGFWPETYKYIVSLPDGRVIVLSVEEINSMREDWRIWSKQTEEKVLRQKILENFKKK